LEGSGATIRVAVRDTAFDIASIFGGIATFLVRLSGLGLNKNIFN
jgi:hypothetical protein